MGKNIKSLDEALDRLASGGRGGSFACQAHLVGAAYEGSPIQEKALVYVYAGKEYLVPVTNAWDGNRVTESVVRLDLAERVVSRPRATSKISEMLRSRKISHEARVAILNGIHAWFLPEQNYTIRIVPFGKGTLVQSGA